LKGATAVRMKSTAIMGTVEMVGEITDIRVKDEFLVMNVRTTVGWNLRAALSHEDLLTFLKLMFKPSNLAYALFGFGKPRDKERIPEY
jgi:hypothetical protein